MTRYLPARMNFACQEIQSWVVPVAEIDLTQDQSQLVTGSSYSGHGSQFSRGKWEINVVRTLVESIGRQRFSRSDGKSRWIPPRAQTRAGPANVGENQQVVQNVV